MRQTAFELDDQLDATGASSASEPRRIAWAEDVVDNEGLGRKRSKGKLVLDLQTFDRGRLSPTRAGRGDGYLSTNSITCNRRNTWLTDF